jgi:hypothetical protein
MLQHASLSKYPESRLKRVAILFQKRLIKQINGAILELYSHLFESEHQVSDGQRLWNERAMRLSGFSHLALLLDPRPRYRAFAISDPLITGSVVAKILGNTDFLTSADTALRDMADTNMQGSKEPAAKSRSRSERTV